MPDERIVPRELARDPYGDPTPCGGARKEIISESRLVEGDGASNGPTGLTSPGRHPTHQANSETALPYEPNRLTRAITELRSEQLGPLEYRVWGGRHEHHVKLDVDPPCDCEDFYYRGREILCAHVLHCLMREGNQDLLIAAGEIMRQMQEQVKAASQAIRRLEKQSTRVA